MGKLLDLTYPDVCITVCNTIQDIYRVEDSVRESADYTKSNRKQLRSPVRRDIVERSHIAKQVTRCYLVVSVFIRDCYPDRVATGRRSLFYFSTLLLCVGCTLHLIQLCVWYGEYPVSCYRRQTPSANARAH